MRDICVADWRYPDLLDQAVLNATLDILAYTMHPPRLPIRRNLKNLVRFQSIPTEDAEFERPIQRTYRLPGA